MLTSIRVDVAKRVHSVRVFLGVKVGVRWSFLPPDVVRFVANPVDVHVEHLQLFTCGRHD